MTLRVTFCVVCTGEIPSVRATRKAVTCSPEHAKEFRNIRRSEASQRKCRLCGRPWPRRFRGQPVLHEHNEVADVVIPTIAATVTAGPGLPTAVDFEPNAITNEQQQPLSVGNVQKLKAGASKADGESIQAVDTNVDVCGKKN